MSGQVLTDCNAGLGDKRAGAYTRGRSNWQAMTVRLDASGTLLWLRTDAYRLTGKRATLKPLNPTRVCPSTANAHIYCYGIQVASPTLDLTRSRVDPFHFVDRRGGGR